MITYDYYRIFYYVAQYKSFTESLPRHCTITSQISQGA